jgi:hypothetical protein
MFGLNPRRYVIYCIKEKVGSGFHRSRIGLWGEMDGSDINMGHSVPDMWKIEWASREETISSSVRNVSTEQ